MRLKVLLPTLDDLSKKIGEHRFNLLYKIK